MEGGYFKSYNTTFFIYGKNKMNHHFKMFYIIKISKYLFINGVNVMIGYTD